MGYCHSIFVILGIAYITQYICFICFFYPVICVLLIFVFVFLKIQNFAHPAELIIMYFIDSEVTSCSAKGFERSPIADPSLLNAPCNQALPICSVLDYSHHLNDS